MIWRQDYKEQFPYTKENQLHGVTLSSASLIAIHKGEKPYLVSSPKQNPQRNRFENIFKGRGVEI